ncbi:MAG: hypothetical protein JJU45_13385 [Acidimicrobiia bacterium]|nr:hypothetical protein [Acidimicrobiia bacterium]
MDDREKEDIGKVAGLGLGLASGARLGSMLIPVPVVGTFVGAVAGGALGSQVGRKVGKAVLDGAGAFMDTLREDTSEERAPGPVPRPIVVDS